MSTNKYLRREVAKKCPVHSAILEKAREHLAEYGYFAKTDVVQEVNMSAVAEAVRWDYIADFIREQGSCELVPLAPSFWHGIGKGMGHIPSTSETRRTMPERFIAGGHGKKTAGYALVTLEDGVLAIKRLEHKRQLANGVGKAFRHFANELVKRDLLEEPESRILANTVTN